ncbi:DnaA/Hda family protein [Lentibacillus sp. N15]|uniref:DnaA ATPase domain-containing protein n=1 Tax=Lentibacillus songyuanensis TaxID=3136161 RepID=UPI0031BB35E3
MEERVAISNPKSPKGEVMNMSNDTWQEILTLIKSQVSIPSFQTWIKPVKAEQEGTTWNIIASNEFSRDWLESKYLSLFKDAIREVTKESPEVVFITEEKKETHPQTDLKLDYIVTQINRLSRAEKNQLFQILKKIIAGKPTLNQQYTFESFIVGAGNRFAYSVAQAVTESIGEAYNPLFLYGKTGVGKTHLIQAIGNEVLKQDQEKVVIYLTAEKFSDEWINNVLENNGQDFRKQIGQADVLLIDDIQFFMGKEQAQQEFFHIFNELHLESKQIVITGDRLPSEMSGMFDPLRGRFEWGLVTEILPAEQETGDKWTDDLGDASYSDHANQYDADRLDHLEAEIVELKSQLQKIDSRLNDGAV